MRVILFIQGGGGTAVHDTWDNKLVDSLRRELGDDHDVLYPRMPDEDDPKYAKWAPAIRKEIAGLSDGAVLIGHSIGGTILVRSLAEQPPDRKLSAIVLASSPFVGEGGWPPDDFELPPSLGTQLPSGVQVHLYHGLEDDTVPPEHAELYARLIPQAVVHKLPGRDHQLNNDLSEVADLVRTMP